MHPVYEKSVVKDKPNTPAQANFEMFLLSALVRFMTMLSCSWITVREPVLTQRNGRRPCRQHATPAHIKRTPNVQAESQCSA
jgi:hypothetical protein